MTDKQYNGILKALCCLAEQQWKVDYIRSLQVPEPVTVGRVAEELGIEMKVPEGVNATPDPDTGEKRRKKQEAYAE